MKKIFTLLFCFACFYSYSQSITTVVGNGIRGYTGDNGLAVNAELYNPVDINFDTSGNIYVSDAGNNVIRKVNVKTGIITTVAGTGTAGFSGDSGLAIDAELNAPQFLVFDKKNNLYFNDIGNNRIRKIDTETGIITTIAGNGSHQQQDTSEPDTVLAVNAEIFPEGLAINNAGTILFIAETLGGGKIRKLDLSTGILVTIVNPRYGYGNNSFYGSALIADSVNNIYVSCNDGRIRRIDAITNTVTIVAGNGFGYSGDGDSAIKAEFALPQGITFDAFDNFYIADFGNARLRKINRADSIVNTIAGNGDTLYNGDNIPAINAQLSLWGIHIDTKGNIYIADLDNNRIRKISSSILPVKLLSFTAQKQNTTTLLNWQTANEINNKYFNIERSADAIHFTAIGNKQATNNVAKSSYAYIDNSPLSGINYYRLKQVDKDGKFTYSNIVSVDFEKNNLFTISPNPAKDHINITSSASVNDAQITITNVNGNTLYSTKHNFINGEQLNVPVSLFANQTLFITITTPNDKQQVKVMKE